MEMDQYLLIPFLGEWTSIYQLFWCSPGVQGFDTLPYGDVNNQWIWVKSSTKDGGHNRMHMFASSSRHCYLPSISTCTTRLAVVDRSVRTKMKGTILCNICIMYIYILYIYCTFIVHLLYIHIYVHIIWTTFIHVYKDRYSAYVFFYFLQRPPIWSDSTTRGPSRAIQNLY